MSASSAANPAILGGSASMRTKACTTKLHAIAAGSAGGLEPRKPRERPCQRAIAVDEAIPVGPRLQKTGDGGQLVVALAGQRAGSVADAGGGRQRQEPAGLDDGGGSAVDFHG